MGFASKYRALMRYPRLSAEKIGRSPLFCLIDALWCYLRYGAGMTDYFCMRFYEKNHASRNTFITARRNYKMLKTLNAPETWALFSDKRQFNKTFSQYLGREILDLTNADESAVASFLERHPKALQKPVNSIGGRGICLRTEQADSPAEILAAGGLLEQFVEQHPALNTLYDGAVNTLRIVTFMTQEGPRIFACGLRIGNGGIVDNVSSGGFSAGVDITTGTLCTDGADLLGRQYQSHPLTHTPIKGFTLPYFDQSVAMVCKAALQCPRCRYIGWDVAITPNGPLLIEANHNPGYHVYEVPENCGYYPKYLSWKNN